MCLPLLIFPCTIKSRSSLLAQAHPDGPRKRAVKWSWCGVVEVVYSGGPKEAQVYSYSSGGANMPSHVGTLAPTGKYD